MQRTLMAFDKEMPRTPGCINNRTALVETLNLQSHVKANKESMTPHKSVLEVVTSQILESSHMAHSQPQQHANGADDVIIDDDVEGETMLGEGRAGVFRSQHLDSYSVGLQPKPVKSQAGKRGMAGPLTSGGLQRETREPARQWKMGPALQAETGRNYGNGKERLSPPHRLDPLHSTANENAEHITSANARRSKKKAKEPDTVQDALAAIKNSRKRHPGASFLAHDTRKNSGVESPDISFDISNRSFGSANSRHRLRSIETGNDSLEPEVHNGKQKHSEPRRKSKGHSEKHQWSSKMLHVEDNVDLNSDQKRSYKKPIAYVYEDSDDTPQNKPDRDGDNVTSREYVMEGIDAVSKMNTDEVTYSRKESLVSQSSDVTSESCSSLSAHASPSRDVDQAPKAYTGSGNSHGFKKLTADKTEETEHAQSPANEDIPEESTPAPLAPVHPITQAPPAFKTQSSPIDINTAADLKRLILGMANKNFNDAWKYQSFCFCDLPSLQYGIVQKKGGSCGVLASVQACLMQRLLFAGKSKPTTKCLAPSRKRRREALAEALATILWRAGQGESAVVALRTQTPQFELSTKFKGDSITETLVLNKASSFDHLLAFLKLNVAQFEFDGSNGAILCLFSAILSRTIQGVQNDMDDPKTTLIGAHGYCTQEAVNLLLTGRAASNVFNDTTEVDSGTGAVTLLKGIGARSDIGFLSLAEHHKSCQVGTYFKVPRLPIWVVYSEEHFSVLFSLNKDLLNNWRAERRFDLYHYDGLARQGGEVRLTLDTSNPAYRAPPDDDQVPPLELCIRTKWPDAEIDWNGSEPIVDPFVVT